MDEALLRRSRSDQIRGLLPICRNSRTDLYRCRDTRLYAVWLNTRFCPKREGLPIKKCAKELTLRMSNARICFCLFGVGDDRGWLRRHPDRNGSANFFDGIRRAERTSANLDYGRAD